MEVDITQQQTSEKQGILLEDAWVYNNLKVNVVFCPLCLFLTPCISELRNLVNYSLCWDSISFQAESVIGITFMFKNKANEISCDLWYTKVYKGISMVSKGIQSIY